MKIKEHTKQLKTDLPAVLIAIRKKETPVLAKVLAVLVIGYALSPIDLIPDFIPVLGYLDDLILLPALIAVVIRLIPHEVFVECQREAEGLWDQGKPKKWYYAIPILIIWCLLLLWLIKMVVHSI